MIADLHPDEPRPRLLIIEDEEGLALMLRAIFHPVGWGVLVAYSAAEARAYLPDHPASILLDLNLPDMAGEDLIEEIRRRSPDSRIVILTAIPPDEPRIARVLARRPDAILHKPAEYDDLMAAVKGPIPLKP